jgi:hypothetical protein
MDYIVSNETIKRQIIVSTNKVDGRMIYNGHKMGIPDSLLPIILRHHHERYNSTFIFFDYKKWSEIYDMEKITPTMTECWFRNADSSKGLLQSYDTLLNLIEEKFGKFKNIYIAEN